MNNKKPKSDKQTQDKEEQTIKCEGLTCVLTVKPMQKPFNVFKVNKLAKKVKVILEREEAYATQKQECGCHYQCGCNKGECNCYSLEPQSNFKDIAYNPKTAKGSISELSNQPQSKQTKDFISIGKDDSNKLIEKAKQAEKLRVKKLIKGFKNKIMQMSKEEFGIFFLTTDDILQALEDLEEKL